MPRSFLQDHPEGVILVIHVQPGARRNEYTGLYGEAVKVKVAAPPVEGAANEALCRFLARLFKLPQRAIQIQTGQSGRRKRVLLKGATREAVLAVMDQDRDGYRDASR